jgi:integrase
VYKRKGRHSWDFKGRTADGWVLVSTGTSARPVAKLIEAMWERLAEYRAWDVLGRVPKALGVGELYDLWLASKYDLTTLRERLNDTDVEPLVEEFLKVYRSNGVKSDSSDHVEAHVRWLLPVGEARLCSTVTPGWITLRLADYKGRPNTRRKVHSSWSVFFDYCTAKGLFSVSPMAKVTRPKLQKPPIKFYELGEVESILDHAQSPEIRALWSLMYGTGIEISPALTLRRQDFDELTHEVRAEGTKAHTRDRMAVVDDWAWPAVVALLRHKLPAAEVWPGWNRWTCSDLHREAVIAAKLERRYPMKNSRHTWAVGQARAGVPVHIIQRQLGHSSPKLTLDTYGRFMPDGVDRKHWQGVVSESNARRRGTVLGARGR